MGKQPLFREKNIQLTNQPIMSFVVISWLFTPSTRDKKRFGLGLDGLALSKPNLLSLNQTIAESYIDSLNVLLSLMASALMASAGGVSFIPIGVKPFLGNINVLC